MFTSAVSPFSNGTSTKCIRVLQGSIDGFIHVSGYASEYRTKWCNSTETRCLRECDAQPPRAGAGAYVQLRSSRITQSAPTTLALLIYDASPSSQELPWGRGSASTHSRSFGPNFFRALLWRTGKSNFQPNASLLTAPAKPNLKLTRHHHRAPEMF